MYFIEEESDLVGKEILLTDFFVYTDVIVIVTKDKGIFMADKQEFEDTETYDKEKIIKELFTEGLFTDRLIRLKIITNEEIEEYEHYLKEKQRIENEKLRKQKEEREYKEYLRLKEKYGNKID